VFGWTGRCVNIGEVRSAPECNWTAEGQIKHGPDLQSASAWDTWLFNKSLSTSGQLELGSVRCDRPQVSDLRGRLVRGRDTHHPGLIYRVSRQVSDGRRACRLFAKSSNELHHYSQIRRTGAVRTAWLILPTDRVVVELAFIGCWHRERSC